MLERSAIEVNRPLNSCIGWGRIRTAPCGWKPIPSMRRAVGPEHQRSVDLTGEEALRLFPPAGFGEGLKGLALVEDRF